MATSFIVNEADLAFILKQIKVAEAETLAVTTTGVTAAAALQAIIGPSAAILPMGLRHVDGSNNNLLPGGELLGAADTVLPRLADPSYTTGTGSTAFSDLTHLTNTSYASPGSVVDTAPRTVSNLIVDQTNTNPAAVAAWHANPLAVAAWEAAHPGQVLSPDYIPTNTELAVIHEPVARYRPLGGLQWLDDPLRPVLRPRPRPDHQGRQRHGLHPAAAG